VVVVLVSTVARDVAAQAFRDIPAALLYVSNWWSINQEQSYFELIGRGNMLAHLWSLAVEEQFYLVWPAVLGALCFIAVRFGRPRRRLVLAVALGGAVASTLWMTYLSSTRGYPIDADPTRVYFGTDAHAMSVLMGAALATVWNVAAFHTRVVAATKVIYLVIGVAGLGVAVWLFTHVTEYTPWLYRGGFLLAAAVFALVIAAATHPASPLGPLLDVAPMRWVGERSYGIYLWHWPIFLVTRPGVDVPWEGVWVNVARVAVVLVVAELSYRYVEVPVRQGAVGRWWARQRARTREFGAAAAWTPGSARTWISALAVAVGAAVLASLALTAPSSADQQTQKLAERADIVDTVTTPGPSVKPIVAPTPAASHSPSTTPTSATTPTAAASAPPTSPVPGSTPAVPAGLSTADISWYGTSVSLWAVEVLRAELPGVKLDAGNNRSPGFILDRVLRDRDRGTLRRAVVMHLGDAGPVSEDGLDAALTTLSDRERIVIINSTARFAFVPEGNATIARVAARHPNVVVADWKGYSSGHADWFKDGLHLTEKGKPYFARFVRKVMLGV
jgi:peptidoglycan/LPS O-acetylase OafA/YrhL